MLSKIKTIDELYSKGVIKNQLEYLNIRHFRQFSQNLSINFDHPLTILVGKNGAGKSTLLKLVKSMAKGRTPNNYFFETEWDKFNDQGVSEFSYKLDNVAYKEINTQHFSWVFAKDEQSLNSNKEIKDYLEQNNNGKSYSKIVDIEFKSLIGSFEKNTFFDNQTSKADLKSKVDYAKRVTKKVQQSIDTKTNNGKKARVINVSQSNVEIINDILGKNYTEIKIIEHKFFSGTWGTSIIFNSMDVYSEANSGSGEFIVANIVNKLSSIPSGSLLLLDEPELSLHSGAQKKLFSFFLDLIIKKKIQIIISTHSQSFVEHIPSICVKNFISNQSGKTIIEQGVNYLNAFDNLGVSFDCVSIIVEDDLAKKILDKVALSERLDKQFNIRYFSGGASSIKTSLITTFSKVDDAEKFIVFDGDMFKTEVVDLSKIPESDKTKIYLEEQIKLITGININNFPFHVDGGKQGSNKEQRLELYKKYISFYKERVMFLPEKIPEDIIYDRSYILCAFSFVDINELDSIKNSKEKFKVLSDKTGIPVDSLYDLFIGCFISQKTNRTEYSNILNLLKSILSSSKGIK
ncbi:AAA family ATPase [Photobacterium sp. Alg240-V54]|uniref:AAA family ATPase n=1 Tax=Photobacterium sp. Alg240-V54 TaxID=2305995 RepID=UPI0013D89111|nr:AAA family ATPase [Photobacterium sp. Alg240-V54]